LCKREKYVSSVAVFDHSYRDVEPQTSWNQAHSKPIFQGYRA